MSLPRLQRFKGFDLPRHCANDMPGFSHQLPFSSVTLFTKVSYFVCSSFSLYYFNVENNYIKYYEHSAIRPHTETQSVY